jgi:hypothetical protein
MIASPRTEDCTRVGQQGAVQVWFSLLFSYPLTRLQHALTYR